jgi:uncharacterized protein
MTTLELLRRRRVEINRIAAKHGAYNIRVFGSVARGDEAAGSDIDLLIDKGAATSSWFPAGLVLELEEVLGCKVEIVTEKALYPALRNDILSEAVPL